MSHCIVLHSVTHVTCHKMCFKLIKSSVLKLINRKLNAINYKNKFVIKTFKLITINNSCAKFNFHLKLLSLCTQKNVIKCLKLPQFKTFSRFFYSRHRSHFIISCKKLIVNANLS